MNRIDKLFIEKKNNILSVYFTAGYPQAGAVTAIIKSLVAAGADMVEIGMPFSDPVADGPVIQASSQAALRNGMNIKTLFSQLKYIRREVDIPLILMGYINPVMQFGVSTFCRQCAETGIDGVILPDLPPEIYEEKYRDVFEEYDLCNILLISPQTSDERINEIDSRSRGFVYMVSSSSVTGRKGKFSDAQLTYFKRVNSLNLKNPVMTGFGISDSTSFHDACKYSNGGIIGSAFITALGKGGDLNAIIRDFIHQIREDA
ncbi:MAG TPA: tryptophan synthase subunit alpha [Bacteroidales bacterium]|nr:tryptophan synthase subunit alpha [Bacteroidales bacterium]